MVPEETEADPRPRRDQVRNRAALIDAARRLFAEEGVDAAFDAVARRAGLSSATLYRHFPTRDALLAEVHRRNLTDLLERLERLHRNGDPWRAFVEYAAWAFAAHFGDRALTRGLAAFPNGLDTALDEQRRIARSRFIALIDDAKRQGRFRPDRWLDDVLLFFAANETLAALGETARPSSARLLQLMLDCVVVGQNIDEHATPPDPLTMDSVLTRYLAQA